MIINIKIYKYAQNEYRHKTQSISAKNINSLNVSVNYKRVRKLINTAMLKLDKDDIENQTF